ncbi:MAG: hypothetical protein R6U21_06295 [Thermoplasmatota archaeon]
MSGKITKMMREYVLGLSILATIVGAIVTIFGVLGILEINILSVSSDLLVWCPYILVVGIIILLGGVWYLYDFFRNKKILLDDLQTKKRSEFLKNHAALKDAARHLPSKYQNLLEEKEKELNVK